MGFSRAKLLRASLALNCRGFSRCGLLATTCQRTNNTMDWTIPSRCAIMFFRVLCGVWSDNKIGSAKLEIIKIRFVSAAVSRECKELTGVYDIVKCVFRSTYVTGYVRGPLINTNLLTH